MRHLSSDSDLGDIPEALRSEVVACLHRWLTSGVALGPDEAPVVLVEPSDSVDTVAALLGDTADDDFMLPAEWVTDHGSVLEAFICWSDDGHGISLLVPKTEQTDPALLALCADQLSPPP